MAAYAVLGGLALTTLGMMLVVGGVLATGLMLPGVVLIALGLAAFAAAAVLHGVLDAHDTRSAQGATGNARR